MAESLIQISSKPGINRDGTLLDSDGAYTDGQWVRFDRGRPRKMGGYRAVNKYLLGIARSLYTHTKNGLTYIHAGSSALLERLYIDDSGNTSVVVDRTPSSLTASDENLWQFDAGRLTSGDTILLAQVAPNLSHISNNVGGQLFYGDMHGTAALTELTVIGGDLPTGVSLTGGVVVLDPYAFVYGDDGYVAWSVPGDFTDFVNTGSGAANITDQKIVKALPLRGGPGNSPSGLFWSVNSLLRASFVGGDTIFDFDTISHQSSILSSSGVIEYDGIYYWAGVDRFLMMNGVVREIDNSFNKNFFFDNLNWDYRQKVFATKVPRFGEIWFCFPKKPSTEPNWAVVYKPNEGIWYDTPLPEGGRAAGLPAMVYPKPIMSGVRERNYVAQDAEVSDGGSSYTAGDVLTVDGGIGGIPVEITVDTVDGGGAITALTIGNAGNYTTPPDSPVSVSGGTGSGATLDITFAQPYTLWLHESGVDAIDGISVQPINSYFDTAVISLPLMPEQPVNKGLQVLMVEPDFIQQGPLTAQVFGRANARSTDVAGEVKTIVQTPSTPQEQVVYFKEQRRQLRLRFGSNSVGGDYLAGRIIGHIQPGDGTVIG